MTVANAKYRLEDPCRMARAIASHDPFSAPAAVAEAIVRCAEHGLWARRDSFFSGKVGFAYRNWFGPTCTVDDVFERMTMREWKCVCRDVVSLVLYDKVKDMPMEVCPYVTAVSEIDTDIISEIRVEFTATAVVADRIVDWLEKRREEQYGRAE